MISDGNDKAALIETAMPPGKSILLLVSKQRKHADVEEYQKTFIDYIKAADASVTTRIAGLKDFVFLVTDRQVRIFHPQKGFDVADFDLLVFKQWADEPQRATAVAAYARMRRIPYIDDIIPLVGESKLDFAFTMAGQHLPTPTTLFGRQRDVMAILRSEDAPIRPPYIVKDVNGRKGRDNHLCQTLEEMQLVFRRNKDLEFVVQEFIPNDGDWRVLVLGGEARLAIRRVAAPGSHLNNTSAGGTGERADLDSLPKEALRDVLKAVEAGRLSVAGADLILDKNTGRHYILELNRNPQLDSGGCLAEKLGSYSEYLVKLARQERLV